MTFHAFCRQAEFHNCPEADFIADWNADRTKPRRVSSWIQLLIYLRTQNADELAVNAARKVWKAFSK